jgi:hypothetical protein
MRDKIVVFEEIYDHTRPLIEWYRIKGCRIYYFRLNGLCKDKRWARRYIKEGELIKIDSKYDISSLFVGMYPDPVYDNIEKIAKVVLSECPVAAMIAGLYGDEDICDIFKKEIGGKLERFYYLNYIFNNLNKVFPHRQICFVPTLQKEGYRISIINADDYFGLLSLVRKSGAVSYDHENIFFPFWFRLTGKLYGLGRFLSANLKIFAFTILTAFGCLIGAFKRYKGAKKSYKFGIMILSQEAQFATESQKVDFLIDERDIKKNDTLFISTQKLSSQNRNYLARNRLNFVDGILMKFPLNADKGTVLSAITLLFKSIRYRRKVYILENSLLALIYRLIWIGFKEEYHVEIGRAHV